MAKKEQKEVYIKYVLDDFSITSADQLIQNNPLFKGVKLSELAKYDGGTGVSNETLINEWWGEGEDNPDNHKWPELPIGCVLYVKPSVINRDSLSLESTGQIKKFQSWSEYVTQTQKELNNLPTYVPAYDWSGGLSYSLKNRVRGINSFFRVWIYCKALEKVWDVTDFCKLVNTNTSLANSDTFTIDLAFIVDNPSNVGISDSYTLKEKNVVICNPFQKGIVSSFAKNITENDIVFISFEQLECEEDRKKENPFSTDFASPTFIEESRLANQYYDFMGLVQSVKQDSNAGGQGRITIQGQSFSKMFNEDEAVFRPISALEDNFSGNIILGDSKKRGWVKRFFVDSEFHSLFQSGLRTIDRTLKFYLNLISNVNMVSVGSYGQEHKLFSSWGNERTRLFDIKVSDKGSVDEVQQSYAPGIYQIIKLQMQPELANRHLSDGAICNPEGTIMNLLQKTCSAPLVEMIMDTYKNTYDIICRVPPFGKQAILDAIDAVSISVYGTNLNFVGKSLTGVLSEEQGANTFGVVGIDDVMSENLSWENNFYTWFELNPQGTIIPVDDMVSLCYIPTLFLNSYIELWGSRKMSVVSPYTVLGMEGKTNTDEIKQAVNDLCWLVESNFYLPFTRKGTITLAVPDRRFKKGQWIRYEKTGEIFYVDGVQQVASVSSSNVSRQTVLSVSRGLVEKYVTTNNKDGYFDIFDFKKLANELEKFYKQLNNTNKKTTLSLSPIMNNTLFSFFCERKQFE